MPIERPKSSSPSEASSRTREKPTPLAELLELAQVEAARHAGAAITPTAWHAAVGARIAARTRVGRLARGTLTIYVASAAWANELTFLADDIVVKLQRSGLEVTNVRFQIKDLGPPPRTVTSRQSVPAQRAPKADLPAALQRRLALVDDPRLRDAIAEAAALSLGAAKLPTR